MPLGPGWALARGQLRSFGTLPHFAGQWAVEILQWAVEVLLYTASLPQGSGQWNACGGAVRWGAVRCGAVRCGVVWCGVV